jgi:hypothetical protein
MLTEQTLDTGTVSINDVEGPRSGPTLILLQGTPDLGGALSEDEACWAESLLPRGILIQIPDVGHQIHAGPGTHPIRFEKPVTDFLETV